MNIPRFRAIGALPSPETSSQPTGALGSPQPATARHASGKPNRGDSKPCDPAFALHCLAGVSVIGRAEGKSSARGNNHRDMAVEG